MVLVFLGSLRATVSVFLSIPLSALAAFILLYFGGSSINTMILAGLALVFSRLIDNAVIVLENIFRHLEMGEPPEVAAEKGGDEVSMAVLAATLTSSIVFFPVTFLYGVSRFLFSALALAVVLSLVASYFVALTGRAALLREVHEGPHGHGDAEAARRTFGGRFNAAFADAVHTPADVVRAARSHGARRARGWSSRGITGVFIVSLVLYPFLGVAFFPRTDAGQFVINLKSPSGSRIEVTAADVDRVEALVRRSWTPRRPRPVASNIGVQPGFSSIYTSNAGPHTATVQVALKEDHRVGSYDYMARMRRAIETRAAAPERLLPVGRHGRRGAQPGAAGANRRSAERLEHRTRLRRGHRARRATSGRCRASSDVFIPQDIDYPSLRLDIDRERAATLGLDQREVVSNVITALTSNQMIAPSYWVDPKSGNDYMLTVQYPENQHPQPARSARHAAARGAAEGPDAARRGDAGSRR